MYKRLILFILLGSLIFTLALAAVAVAWTPEEIFNDFATNGKLTREYTDSELRAYLNDATLAQYADQDIKDRLDKIVLDLIDRDEFPFTGFQIAMACIVVVVLIGGGIALRLFSKPRKTKQDS